MKKIAIFASGSGSNAENIVRYFQASGTAEIAFILSNNPDAYVLQRARKLGVPAHVCPRAGFVQGGEVDRLLREEGVDLIVLAGFLLLVPKYITDRYAGRIVNIHPALLPAFGGKGMYGDHVHRAVRESGATESGITIHHVNEFFDSGDIIFQAKVPVEPQDTPETIAAKVHELEYRYFPEVIDTVVQKLK